MASNGDDWGNRNKRMKSEGGPRSKVRMKLDFTIQYILNSVELTSISETLLITLLSLLSKESLIYLSKHKTAWIFRSLVDAHNIILFSKLVIIINRIICLLGIGNKWQTLLLILKEIQQINHSGGITKISSVHWKETYL